MAVPDPSHPVQQLCAATGPMNDHHPQGFRKKPIGRSDLAGRFIAPRRSMCQEADALSHVAGLREPSTTCQNVAFSTEFRRPIGSRESWRQFLPPSARNLVTADDVSQILQNLDLWLDVNGTPPANRNTSTNGVFFARNYLFLSPWFHDLYCPERCDPPTGTTARVVGMGFKTADLSTNPRCGRAWHRRIGRSYVKKSIKYRRVSALTLML